MSRESYERDELLVIFEIGLGQAYRKYGSIHGKVCGLIGGGGGGGLERLPISVWRSVTGIECFVLIKACGGIVPSLCFCCLQSKTVSR